MGDAISEVIGRNAQAIRERAGVGREEVALAARFYGALWNYARVSRIESGTNSLTVESLVLLALALNRACGRPVRLSDLLEGAENLHTVQIGKTRIGLTYLQAWFGGKAVDERLPGMEYMELGQALFASRGPGVADLDDAKARIADGIERADEDDLSIAGEFNSDLRSFVVDSISLWGRPFSDERTARVAESAGTTSDLDAITEAMKDELHAWHMARVAASKGYPMPGETQGGK